MLKQLEIDLEVDLQRGFTSRGPHREDLGLLIASRPLQDVASRGEARTVLLALKIIEARIIGEARQTPPILILDDVFGELDGKRRHLLATYLSGYQTLITTTDADLVQHNFTSSCNIIPLQAPKGRKTT